VTRNFSVSGGLPVVMVGSFAEEGRHHARLKELQSAQQMVIEDTGVPSGIPIIQGTRIPVYDVASLEEDKTQMDELKEQYPRLSEEQFRLASLYAKARPLRGRPKQNHSPIRAESPSRRNTFGRLP
jgi:uncharacterized protein (DUF433 family)